MKQSTYTNMLQESGITTLHTNEYVAAVGTRNGHIYESCNLRQVVGMIHTLDVMWVEVRPNGQPFRPKPGPFVIKRIDFDPVAVTY